MGKLIGALLLVIVAIVAKKMLGNVSMEESKIAKLNADSEAHEYNREYNDKRISALEFQIRHRKQGAAIVPAACWILAVIMLAASFITSVPTGYTGIKTTFGKVENDTVASGANFIYPWQSIVLMDNRAQKVTLDTQAFSSDIQQVDVTLSVNYVIDSATAQNLYRTVGTSYYENVMYPRILENTKAVFSRYTAESLVEKRNELSLQVATATTADMKQYGINISSISIENIDFTDAFTDAVEAKQVAAQKKLTAETEQAQKTMEEEAAAKRTIIAEKAKAEQAVIAANADLEVVKIQAEASLYAGQREAEMNQRIAEALTPDLLGYYWIKEWDGKVPTTMLGTDTTMLLTLDNLGK